jgi:hypothetical protein
MNMTVNFRKIVVGTLTALAFLATSIPAYAADAVDIELAAVCTTVEDLRLFTINYPQDASRLRRR